MDKMYKIYLTNSTYLIKKCKKTLNFIIDYGRVSSYILFI